MSKENILLDGLDQNGCPTTVRTTQHRNQYLYHGSFTWGHVTTGSETFELKTQYRINGLKKDKSANTFDQSAAQKPVSIWLHGGPGLGLRERYIGYADPAVWNHVVYSQRGSALAVDAGQIGTSDFSANLHNNTTSQLVDDLEALRRHLEADLGLNAGKILISGGSWGTVLAMEYAKKYPDKVLGLCLTGIILGDDRTLRHGMGENLFKHPEPLFRKAYENYIRFAIENAPSGHLVEEDWRRGHNPHYRNVAQAYFELLSDYRRPEIRLEAFRLRLIVDYLIDGAYDGEDNDDIVNPDYYRYDPLNTKLLDWQRVKVISDLVKMHFTRHGLWLDPDRGVLAGIDVLNEFIERDVPVVINRSANDPLLPPWVTADFLHDNIPNATVFSIKKGVHHDPADIMRAIGYAQREIFGSSAKPKSGHQLVGTLLADVIERTSLTQPNESHEFTSKEISPP